MKIISALGVILSVMFWVNTVSASNVSIPCNLILDEDNYAGVSVVGFAPSDIATLFPNDMGYVGFVAEIKTTKQVIKRFTGNAEYKVAGPRVEFDSPQYDQNSAITNLYRDEFRKIFGPLPDVNCYLP